MNIDPRIRQAMRDAAAKVAADWPPLTEKGRADLAYLAGQVDVSAPVEQASVERRAA